MFNVNRNLIICFSFGVTLANPGFTHAAIYKCVVDGQITFSDTKCLNDHEEIKLPDSSYTIKEQQGILGLRPMKTIVRMPYDQGEAMDLLMKARDDGDPAVYFNIGVINIQQNHFSEALTWLLKSAKAYYKLKDLQGVTSCQLAMKEIDAESVYVKEIDQMIKRLDHRHEH